MLTSDMLLVIYGQKGCCSLSGSRTVVEASKVWALRLTLGLADKDSCVGHLVHDNLSTEHIQDIHRHNSTTQHLANQNA